MAQRKEKSPAKSQSVKSSAKGIAKTKSAPRATKPTKSKVTGNAAKSKRSNSEQASGKAASRLIDQRIRELADWRGKTLALMRKLILKADPEITEEWKWMGTPVWAHHGIICTGESYKQVVKLTFARGASIADPAQLFNSSLEGNTRRAIDIREGETVDAEAFKTLIQAAVAENLRAKSAKSKSTSKLAAKATPGTKVGKPALKETKPSKLRPARQGDVVLLSGGNPQFAKADGDAPVQAYIAAMPDWKQALGKRLDTIIVRSAPRVRKAVKWNSPFYGIEGQGWFLSFHVFTRYVKVTFFAGTSLHPVPPGGTPKSKEARWLDIHEDDVLDEAQFASWVKQAAALPGWQP